MTSKPRTDADLSRAEWQAVAIALADAGRGGCTSGAAPGPAARLWRALTGLETPRPLADPRLEAVRRFVCAARRDAGRAAALAPTLSAQGFNQRQIAALAHLSA